MDEVVDNFVEKVCIWCAKHVRPI